MSNTLSSTMITHPAVSVSGNYERDVGSELRYLGFGKAAFTSLVDGMVLDSKTGKIIKKGGLITKRTSKNVRFEMFSRAPHPTKCKVTAGTEITSSGVTVDSVNGITVRTMLYNPKNNTSCRVEVISTLTLTGQTVGSTTFSCEVGDELEIGPPAIPAGSDAAIILNGTDDQNYNMMQYTRLGVSIDWVAERVKELAGGERFTREKMYQVWELLLKIEKSLIWSDYTSGYATKNTTTGAQTGFTTEEFPTPKGLVKLAANSYDMEGVTTLSKLRRDLPRNMGEYINENMDLIGFCSSEFYGLLQELIAEKHYHIEKEGILDKFGIKCQTFLTSGPQIRFVPIQSFNNAGAEKSLLIFDPASIGYVHFEGLDMKPNNGIQGNAVHGKQDEIVCYYGIETKDSGKTITYVTNAF